VLRPRLHLIRFHGVLAPNAKLRSKIVRAPPERATETATDQAPDQGKTPRMSWARLLKRVFDIGIEHCPNCGGALKIIAAIEDPAGDRQEPQPFGAADPRPAALPGASSRSIPDNLTAENQAANACRRSCSL
jgi:hypothetical protein